MEKANLVGCNIQELNFAELKEIDGGSEFSEAIFRAAGYVSGKIEDAINAVDWNSFCQYYRTC